MANMTTIAEQYFSTLNPLAAKIYRDIEDTKQSFEGLWHSFTDKERAEVINESIMKPEISLQYTDLDALEFDLNDLSSFKKNDLMSFFGCDHGQRVVQDDHASYRDEHSAPFMYQTRSQLNLCELAGRRSKPEEVAPPPVLSELALSHSKVVSELKNALKSHDALKKTESPSRPDETNSPGGFISKMINKKFRGRDEEKERLVSSEPPTQIVASSDNFFRTNFMSVTSPSVEPKHDKRASVAKSGGDLSEEHRGLLCSASLDSSGTEFQSCEELGVLSASRETLASAAGPPTTGFDFLDNW